MQNGLVGRLAAWRGSALLRTVFGVFFVVLAGSLLLHLGFEGGPVTESFLFGALAAGATWVLVTRHRRELDESQARYQRVAENAADVIFRIRVRPDLLLEYASAAFERITGHAPEDVTQRRGFAASLIHPEDRDAALAAFRSARSEPFALPALRLATKDGRYLWMETRCIPVTDDSGGVVAVEGIARDVTESRAAQEALRASERRFEREARVSAGLAELKRRLLRASSLTEVCEAALAQAQALTRSPFGFVAQIEPETGALVALALTREVCEGMEPPPDRLELKSAQGLMGWVRARREPVLSNDVPSDPRSLAAMPAGHVPIGRFLSVPALHGDELVGQIAVANAPTDYDANDVKVLELIAPDVALAITRVRAQQALEGSRAQLHAIIESAMDAIISVDEQGRLVVFNSAAESMFGVSAADAIGSRLDRFIPERFRYKHAEHVRRGATGRAVVESGIGLRADGTEFPLEASVSTVRLGDRHFSTAILRDLTERRRAEEEQMRLQHAVMQSSEDWRRTFDAMPSAVVVLDGSGRVERLNREACGALGADYPDFVGRPLARVAPGEPWRAALRLASGEAATARERVLDDVSGRWFSVAATRVPQRVPGEPRTIVVADDVTPLVNLELSMGRAEKMAAMGALTAGVAHEVRNPLFAIAASVDALGAMLTDRPKVAHLLKLMREQAARMNQLMHELLAYGRPLPKESYADVPVEPLLERSTRACAALASAAGVSIVREGETASVVRGDASRLEEVVTNLLENAVQHSRSGGEVTLSVEEPAAGWVRMSVTDRGPGFRAEDIAKVFEPFFSRRAGGTGLGLSIVQRITEQHGGRVTIANRKEGGASVTVELPTAPA